MRKMYRDFRVEVYEIFTFFIRILSTRLVVFCSSFEMKLHAEDTHSIVLFFPRFVFHDEVTHQQRFEFFSLVFRQN